MREEHAGCNNRSVLELFQCLHDMCRTITCKDLEKIEEEMKLPSDSDTPIEEVFNRVKEAALMSTLGNVTMLEVKKITTAYNVIDKTGKLANDDQKSWGNFKLHFSKECKDYKDELATNSSTEPTAPLMTSQMPKRTCFDQSKCLIDVNHSMQKCLKTHHILAPKCVQKFCM